MARPREFEHAHVIQKVEEVFWEKGFEATTMSDLAQAAGMQRGSLYNAFGDKRQLYLEALKHYGEREFKEPAERLRQVAKAQGTPTALHKLYERLAIELETDEARRGCLVCNACTELAAEDKQVGKLVQHYIGLLQSAIADSLRQDGKLKQAEITPLADNFTATYLGFRIWSKAGFSSSMIRQSAAAVLKVLEF